MKALLICNGEPPGRKLAWSLADNADFILAADGGANIARRFGIRPDCIVGDLDSITASTRGYFRKVPLVHVPSQYSTDLQKALRLLRSKRATEVTIIAATGRRLDFTLGNLASFWKAAGRMRVLFAGDGWTARPVGRKLTLRARKGTIVSLIPHSPCSGVTLRGLRYPLRDAKMPVGSPGVSNEVVRSPFMVTVRRGRMLLIMQ